MVEKTNLNVKITEAEGKTPSITNSALTAVENKILDVFSLVKKTDYDAKISEIENKVSDHNHDKYITTQEFNRLTTENVKARLAQANLITKTDFDTQLKKISDRFTSNKSKHLLVEKEVKKLKTFDLSYFKGKNYFEEDDTQNYLVFQPMYKYFKIISSIDNISVWKSKGLSNESIKAV